MSQRMTPPRTPHSLRRRALLAAALGATGAALLPARAAAAPALVDPYAGAIPLAFPLTAGTYVAPVGDNWHVEREGSTYGWNHREGDAIRAHDGVDVYPLSDAEADAPTVYAPVSGVVAETCWRAANRIRSAPTVRTAPDAAMRPPWDYRDAIDDVIELPLYGNYVWIVSTEAASMGYAVFLCHLQDEPTLRGLAPGQAVTTRTPVGVLGDTGNADGTPQLHVEIHYPAGEAYTCARCAAPKRVTGINPFASLAGATRRDPLLPRRLGDG